MKKVISIALIAFFCMAGIILICFHISNRRKNVSLFIKNKLIEEYSPQIMVQCKSLWDFGFLT